MAPGKSRPDDVGGGPQRGRTCGVGLEAGGIPRGDTCVWNMAATDRRRCDHGGKGDRDHCRGNQQVPP
jgi:hypothetical protein